MDSDILAKDFLGQGHDDESRHSGFMATIEPVTGGDGGRMKFIEEEISDQCVLKQNHVKPW